MTIKDTEELQLKIDDLKDFYATRNRNMLYWRNLYFLDDETIFVDDEGKYIEPESDEKRIVLPKPQNIVEGFRELLLTKEPAISVPQPTVKGKDLVHAEHNEAALLAVWNRASINKKLRDSLWHGLVDGWATLQLVWDKDRDEEESPIRIINQDPYNVYAMPGTESGEWRYVIHAWPRKAIDVMDEWPKSTDGRTRAFKTAKETLDKLDPTEEVTYIDYWDDEVNAVAISWKAEDGFGNTSVETEWIKEPVKHGYGFLPWEIYMPFRLPFKKKGERMAMSVLYPIQKLIKYLDELVSEKATMLSRWQDPPLVTRTERGPDFEPVRTESGMHLRLFTDEDAQYLVHPGPLPQLDTMIDYVGQNIEASSLPKVLQGMYVGDMSGIAMSLLRNPTLMKVGFRQDEIENACISLNRKILKLLEEKLVNPVYLWGRDEAGEMFDTMIDPDEVQGYYRNDVKLSASLPTDDAGTVNMLATLVQLDIISTKTARDVAQQTLHEIVPQSLVDEEKMILAEKIFENPGMIESLVMQLANEINLPYLQENAQEKGGREGGTGQQGERAVQQPAQSVASQRPGMPGGNVSPSAGQRLQELMGQARQGEAGDLRDMRAEQEERTE